MVVVFYLSRSVRPPLYFPSTIVIQQPPTASSSLQQPTESRSVAVLRPFFLSRWPRSLCSETKCNRQSVSAPIEHCPRRTPLLVFEPAAIHAIYAMSTSIAVEQPSISSTAGFVC